MRKLSSALTTALLLAVMMTVTGCSKEEGFTIMVQDIELTVGESRKVEVSGSFTARSTDERVATVTADGTITAVAEGEADVVFTSAEDASQQQTCHVTANWRYHYFEEPILDFTLTLQQVKAMETHEFMRENFWDVWDELQDAPDPWFVGYLYPNEDGKFSTYYAWADKEKGILYCIAMYWSGQKNISREKIRQQLTERYGEPQVDTEREKRIYLSELHGLRIVENSFFIVFYHL